MISRIHSKLGTAGFIVAIVALVAALSGAAIAAQQGLNAKQKKQVKKIAKKYAGKQGPQGVPGPAGPAGAAGAKGDTGAAGANGEDGEDGTDGTDGKSVIVGSAGGECEAGGATVQKEGEPASKQVICNGEDGEDGETGFVETLPYEESVTGAWSIGFTNKFMPFYLESISYGFKLPDGAKATPKFVKEAGEEATNCPGSFAEPEAAPGFLCYYLHFSSPEPEEWPEGAKFNLTSTANTNYSTGNTFKFETGTFTCLVEENCSTMQLTGTWAVTAPADPTP